MCYIHTYDFWHISHPSPGNCSEIGRRGRICGCYSKFNMMGIKELQSLTPGSSDAVFTHIQFTLTLGERQIIAIIYVISALLIYGSSTFLYGETNFPSSILMPLRRSISLTFHRCHTHFSNHSWNPNALLADHCRLFAGRRNQHTPNKLRIDLLIQRHLSTDCRARWSW